MFGQKQRRSENADDEDNDVYSYSKCTCSLEVEYSNCRSLIDINGRNLLCLGSVYRSSAGEVRLEQSRRDVAAVRLLGCIYYGGHDLWGDIAGQIWSAQNCCCWRSVILYSLSDGGANWALPVCLVVTVDIRSCRRPRLCACLLCGCSYCQKMVSR